MPDGNFDESHGRNSPKQAPKARNPLVHWLSAFASLGVLAGMVYWGLQLVQRNPNEVPVIKAMEGPARILPEEPGGVKSSYSGLAVNSVQSDGSAEAPAERVVLAPPPRDLLPEDVAVPKPVSPLKVATVPKEAEPEAIEPAVAALPREPETPLTELEDRAAEDAPVTLKITEVPEGAMIDTSKGVAVLVTDDDLQAAEAAQEAAEQAALDAEKARAAAEATKQSGTKFAPLASLAPQPRPAQLKSAQKAMIVAELKAAATRKTTADPSTQEVTDVPVGSWVVQVGAYDSRDTALSEWARISGRNHDLFGAKKYLIQSVEKGGHTFYRLRTVGFADANASKSFCSALKQRKQDCIAVAVR